MRFLWLLLIGIFWAAPGAVRAENVSDRLKDAMKTLREAGVGSDGATLLDFFRDRTLTDADRLRLHRLIKQLADDDFSTREEATKSLHNLGLNAMATLRKALEDPDPEVAGRVKRCLGALPMPINADIDLLTAAARVLASRRPAATVEVLLAYLPDAADETLQEELLSILVVLAERDGQPDRALVGDAPEKLAIRRLAVARCLARSKHADARPALRKLLQDPDPNVRRRTAQELLLLGDKSGVPPLLSLLKDAPATVALQAEEQLRRLAGKAVPREAFVAADAESRRRCHAAWQAWWQTNDAKIDLKKLNQEVRPLGLTVYCENAGTDSPSRIMECAEDGKPRWQISVRNPVCVQMLPNGRVLFADYSLDGRVCEVDREGKLLWSTLVRSPVVCQRLANGNTFIATNDRLLEVTRGGHTVFTFRQTKHIHCAQKLPNGHIVYLHSKGFLVELDASGEQVQVITIGGVQSWGSVVVLDNGNYLLAKYNGNRVVEMDSTGKILWECAVDTPSWANRLASGNTVVASVERRRVMEFDSAGHLVSEQSTQGKPYRFLKR